MANQYSNKYTDDFIKEVLEFYRNNSNTITCKVFHMKLNKLREILKLNGVEEHTYNQNYRFTKLYRYGNETFVNSNKARQTCIERYGTPNPIGNKAIKQKAKKTRLERYGDENYNNSSKMKLTKLERYGDENYVNTEKIKQTKQEHFGDPWFRNPDKAKQTCLDRYGVDSFSKTLEFHHNSRKLYAYNGENFDSLPELALYVYALDHNESIVKTPCRFSYTYNNEVHYYFPDFLYDGRLIEIKGDHFFNEDGTMCNPFDHTQDGLYEAKHRCGLSNGVEFWKYRDYEFALKYFDTVKENLNLNAI